MNKRKKNGEMISNFILNIEIKEEKSSCFIAFLILPQHSHG